VGREGPGYQIEPNSLGMAVWRTEEPKSAASSDEAAAVHGWKILRRADLSAVTQYLKRAARERLEQADNSRETLLQVDPASPGVLTIRSQRQEFLKPHKQCLEAWDPETEPIGLQKGNTITLLTRWSGCSSHKMVITHVHELRAEDVPEWTKVLDAMGKETEAEQVVVCDLEAQSDVARKLQSTRGAEIHTDTAESCSKVPLLKVYYQGIASGDKGKILDTQRESWI
jgi:hypothetical protein